MQKGKLISFEGIDGSGKSSALLGVKNYLENQGITTLCLRQPGGSSLGDELRNLLKTHPSDIDPLCEVLLLCTSFRACWLEKVKPALDTNTWVLMDRFTDSTIAYQCGGRKLSEETIKSIIKSTVPVTPDLSLYYDVDAQTALQRVAKRGILDNFEKRGLEFLRLSREKYHEIVENNPNRFFTIDTKSMNKKETIEKSIEYIKVFNQKINNIL